MVESFLCSLYEYNYARGARQRCVNAVMGLEFFLTELRKKLTRSRLCLKVVDRLLLKQLLPPMFWLVVNGIACEATLRQDTVLSVGLRLLHGEYLRAKELLRLRISDIAMAGDPRLAHWHATNTGGMRLRLTKTGPEKFIEL